MLDEQYVVGICTTGTRSTIDQFFSHFASTLTENQSNLRVVVAVNGSGSYSPPNLPNITVVNEPRQGIAYARNRVLQEITTDENLIFIDDDEYPDTDWFVNLIKSHKKFPRALITGPVREVTEHGHIVLDSKLRPITNFEHESLRPRAATNNLLIPAVAFTEGLVYFDLFFNGGGSDADLTMSLCNQGFEIRWAADAIMYEIEDAERNNPDWAFQRDCRNAAIYPLVIKRNSKLTYFILYSAKKISQYIIFSLLQWTGESRRKKFIIHQIGYKSLVKGRQTY